MEVGQSETGVEGQPVRVEVRLQRQPPAAGSAEAELGHVDLPGAGVEAEVEPQPQRPVRVVGDVEPLEGRRHLQLGERVVEIRGDRRAVARQLQPVDVLAGDDRRQRVARLGERGLELDARDRRVAVDAGEEPLARELGPAGVGLGEVEEDVVRPFGRRGDAVDDHAIERQHVVVEDPEPAAAGRQHRPGVEPERRVLGIDARLLERRPRVRVAQLEPPGPREVEDRVQVAELDPVDLEERSGLVGGRGGAGRGRRLGGQGGQEPDPVGFLHGREPPERLRRAQVVDGEAAADQGAELDLGVEVRDVEHHRPLRIDDLEAVHGDRRRLVRDQIGDGAQVPGDAADVQLAAVRGQAPLDEPAEARPLQHDRRTEHRADDRADQSDDGCANDTRNAGTRQRMTIVS